MNKLIKGQVIYVDFPHPSFKWANGLKVIVNVKDTELHLVAIDDKGNLELFDDGRYMISCTGINNKGIRVIEGLSFKVDDSLL